MTDSIFSIDSENNVIFYKWGGIGKGHIITKETTKAKLEKIINSRNFFLRPMISISIGNIILLLIIGPLLIPLVLTASLLGLPIYFGMKHFFDHLSNLEAIGVTIFIVLLTFVFIYSYQINKVLKEDKLL